MAVVGRSHQPGWAEMPSLGPLWKSEGQRYRWSRV